MDSYGSLLNLDLICDMSYGVLCIFKCRIELAQLSVLTLSSPYSERPFWLENINISHTVLFLCHLKVFGLEETDNFTHSAIPMPFKGVSLYVMSLKGESGRGSINTRQGWCQVANFRTRSMKYKPCFWYI